MYLGYSFEQTWPILFLCFSLSFLCITGRYLFLKDHCKSQAVHHWPVLGVIPSLIRNRNRMPEWVTEIFFSLGHGIGSFSCQGPIFSKLNIFVTCDPRNIEYILKTNFSNFPKGTDFNKIFDFLGEGIFNSDGEPWRIQRRITHSSLKSSEFGNLLARLTREAVEIQLVPFLQHVARQGSVIDLQDICGRFSFDSNMSALFGRKEKYLSLDLPHNEFAKYTDAASESIFFRHGMPTFCWKLLRYMDVWKERNIAKGEKIIASMLSEYIANNKQGFGNSINLLSMLLKSSDQMLNDQVLGDLMLNLFLAGKDTIATGLVWFFWLVSKTPHVEHKIVEELKSLALNKHKRPCVFDIDEVTGLVYLHAVLCESLRLYAPVPFNIKGVLKEDVLPDGSVVKPGTRIVISFYSEGKMPWIWGEDSLEFKPERWIDDEGNIDRKILSKFFAFNIGPRSCLGKDVSLAQMKLCVAAVLFNFHVEVVAGQQVCSKPGITLGMMNGLLVKVQERVA